MTQDQKNQLLLTLLLERQIIKTQFATVRIPATALKTGIPLGQGKCRGVVLHLNSLVLNTTTKVATADNLNQIYYGDERSQFRELIAGNSSDVIFCTDLQDVFVRGNGVENFVQVLIYLGAEDDFVNLTQ